MNSIKEWMEKYQHFVADDLSGAEGCISEFLQVCESKCVVLWGASAIGGSMQRLFNDIGIKIDVFVDRKYDKIKSMDGIKVFPPSYIAEIVEERQHEVLLISSVMWKYFESLQRDLAKIAPDVVLYKGYELFLPLQSSVCTQKIQDNRLQIEKCPSCTILNHTCPVYRKNLLLNHNEKRINRGGSSVALIGCITSTICSLNCEHCVEHVPYINRDNKRFLPKDKLLGDIRTLADACQFISVLDFIGGEPFLHPDLPEIIAQARKIKNIGVINVFTNGTVMPTEALLTQLAQKFTTVYLSDYSANLTQTQREKIIGFKQCLQDAGVAIFHAKDFTWYDSQSFEHNNDDEDMLAKRYSNCLLKNCYRLYEGMLFRCLHYYAGYMTNNLPAGDEVIRIYDNPETLIERLNHFNDLPYSEACRYCEMPFKSKLVSSGSQLKGKAV